MTDHDSPLDYIDYTSLNFPSDRITVHDIRRAHPDRFDVEGSGRFNDLDTDPDFTLRTAMFWERLIARAAYEAAIGKPGDVLFDRGLTRADAMEELTESYARYGVAQGPHQTEQLVRDLETQAAAQAKGPRR